MVTEKSSDIVAVKIPTGDEPARHNASLHVISEGALQPFAHRSAETHLLAVDDLRGNQVFHCFLQDVFGYSVPNLPGHGNVHSELHQAMIKKGNPRLERHRHADLIHAHKQQLREPEFEFVVGHARKDVTSGMGGVEWLQKAADHVEAVGLEI